MKRLLKTSVLALAVTCNAGLYSAPVAAGGIPVIDVSAIAQMVKEYTVLMEQIKLIENQLNAVTGSRGYGTAAQLPDIRGYFPGELPGLYGAGGTNYDPIRDQLGDLVAAEEFTGTPEEYRDYIQTRERNANAISKATISRAYDAAQKRFDNLNNLAAMINTTDDPKAIQELQARIQVEQAAINTETSKIALMQQAYNNEQQMISQQRREHLRRIMSADLDASPSIN